MNTTHALSSNAVVLAGLLERLEAAGPSDAGQYRDVVARLTAELADVAHDAALDRLLDASPAAALLYENLNYQHAGLCRSLLDASLASEKLAREAIGRAMRTAVQGSGGRS
ncbi:hypothetical protein [Xylophilus sp. ASV27]|uniref:hypothetical protein n=1 Tax=Xylophilus sp. ASV27 TaxID=2795129 RepID=UPI0018EA4407|nr:hypothetical protein [Xylophilus sp. ASV27]